MKNKGRSGQLCNKSQHFKDPHWHWLTLRIHMTSPTHCSFLPWHICPPIRGKTGCKESLHCALRSLFPPPKQHLAAAATQSESWDLQKPGLASRISSKSIKLRMQTTSPQLTLLSLPHLHTQMCVRAESEPWGGILHTKNTLPRSGSFPEAALRNH